MTISATASDRDAILQQALMLVDDDVEIREVIGAVLEAEGYGVATAADGADALRQLRLGSRPCVILLDLRMPGMDGREFRERTVADPGLRDIPVVILSGDHEAPQVAAQIGIECVMKPVDLERLLAIAARFCSHLRASPRGRP
jgi:CheY-like chemotaxis protein